MDKNIEKLWAELEELRDYIAETAGNSYDEGYVTGLNKAIFIVANFDYQEENKF